MSRYDVHDFQREVDCVYRYERYSVRDNGAILRHPHPDKRFRRRDGHWTFGRECQRSGYLFFTSIPIHRIVATAFHGEPPSSEYVVDHISRRKKNNRPENLRWVTKEQNLTENKLTRQFIERSYGSIEAFQQFLGENKQTPYQIQKSACIKAQRESIAQWQADSTIESLTPGAIQREWRTPTAFPLCPDPGTVKNIMQRDTSEYGDGVLVAYLERLAPDAVFCKNRYGESTILHAELSMLRPSISVVSEMSGNAIKPFGLVEITMENGEIVHEAKGTFFEYAGAIRGHCEIAGLPLTLYGITEAEGIDNFC